MGLNICIWFANEEENTYTNILVLRSRIGTFYWSLKLKWNSNAIFNTFPHSFSFWSLLTMFPILRAYHLRCLIAVISELNEQRLYLQVHTGKLSVQMTSITISRSGTIKLARILIPRTRFERFQNLIHTRIYPPVSTVLTNFQKIYEQTFFL